jgi:hypothetical protein
MSNLTEIREALEILAGKRQCLDNLMGNRDIAEAGLAALVRLEAMPPSPPLIRAQALEEAAKELEDYEVSWSQPAAAAIRALKVS